MTAIDQQGNHHYRHRFLQSAMRLSTETLQRVAALVDELERKWIWP
jgi:hypothetical protein